MSTMSRSAFATFTSFESQRSSPPDVDAHNNQQQQQQQQQQQRHHPISPTVNNNSNNPASFPSPTLTNPDMILPYDIERECSTPSPPFHPLQLPSPEHSGYRRNSVQTDNGFHISSAGIGVALSATHGAPHNYQQRNPPPRNNWMFAGHEVRPPLSDIGEEESPTRSRWDGDDEDTEVSEMALDSAPAFKPQWHNGDNNGVGGHGVNRDADGDHDDCSAAGEDTISCSASSSTISAPSEILDKWEEFRTDNGNAAAGIRSEDAAEKENNQRRSQESDRVLRDFAGIDSVRDNNSMGAIREEGGIDGDLDEEMDDEISSAMLSKEAERILENAKKRLTHMEGNLTRARTSFRMTPSPSLLMGTLPLSHRQSTGNMGRSYSTTERRAQTSLAGALMRQRVSQNSSANSSHSRGLSDISVQSAQINMANRDNVRPPFRSFSALGSTNASGFGANDTSPSHDGFEPNAAYKSPVSTFNYIPEDPSELNSNGVSQSDSPHSKPDLLPAQQGNNLPNTPPDLANRVPKISSVEEFNATYPASIPSRSQSQLQVRGLQDQMQDLKSKISTLKVQAQEDNLRRRSLQSLRTPSPFTAAEQWYTTAGEYVGAQGEDANGVRNEQNNERDVCLDTDQPQQIPINTDPSPAPATAEEHKPQNILDRDRPDDQKSIVASLYEDADEEFAYDDSDDIDRAALAEILNEPLDSPVSSDGVVYEDFPPMPAVHETTRHEDREDAFDYEHFFLHSALGNYSRDKARQRRQSYGSTGSVETTRPRSQATVYLDTSPRGRQGHLRNNSADTISTTASFETATEGAEYDGYDEDSGDEIEKALYGSLDGNGMKYSHGDLQFRQYQDPQTSGRRQQTRQTIIATNGSASPTTLSTASTPRASGEKFSYANNKVGNHHRTNNRQHFNDASISIREVAAHLRSPTVMISSLISSAATQYYTPESEDDPVVFETQLGPDDTKLMEDLFQSLGKVALQLQLSPNGDKRSSADERSSIIFRRRLDAARRVLEGQLDV